MRQRNHNSNLEDGVRLNVIQHHMGRRLLSREWKKSRQGGTQYPHNSSPETDSLATQDLLSHLQVPQIWKAG